MAVSYFRMLVLGFFILLFAITLEGAHGRNSIGICYGMLGDNLPAPREVVSMYKSHGIERMRLYEPNHSVLHALRGSNIEVLLGVNNQYLKHLASSYNASTLWVKENIVSYWPYIKFRYIAIGNEVIPGQNVKYVLQVLNNFHRALSEFGLHKSIKVSTVVGTSVIGVSHPPSAGEFSKKTNYYMKTISRFLNVIEAPLLVNIYPYFIFIQDPKNISLPYVLFQKSNLVVSDGYLSYTNLFDAMIDTFYAALKKVKAHRVSIVVSETGWPSLTNHQRFSNHEIARMYNSNLIRHVVSASGTPMRRGMFIETYLFAMFNENKRPGEVINRHWGLFYPNKRPVYPIQFT